MKDSLIVLDKICFRNSVFSTKTNFRFKISAKIDHLDQKWTVGPKKIIRTKKSKNDDSDQTWPFGQKKDNLDQKCPFRTTTAHLDRNWPFSDKKLSFSNLNSRKFRIFEQKSWFWRNFRIWIFSRIEVPHIMRLLLSWKLQNWNCHFLKFEFSFSIRRALEPLVPLNFARFLKNSIWN